MADSVISKQELIDAQKDAQALEEVINGEPGKLIKTRLGRLVYTLASVPQINTMTREEVTSALAPKADKTETAAALDTKANQADTFLKSEVTDLVAPKADLTYVDTAIGAISTDASKQYATLALANADIANIALNKNIFVSENANGGYWYKATAGATSLTKSPYDPLVLANDFTKYTTLAAVTIPNSSNLPNFNSTTKQFVIPAGIIIQNYLGNYATPSAYDNTFTEDGDYRVYYNTYTTTFRTVKGGGGVTGQKNEFLIATARIDPTSSIITMTCDVSYNGQFANDLTKSFCAITNTSVGVPNDLKVYPFYNSTDKTLTFFNDTVFSLSNYRYALSSDVVVAKPAEAGTTWKIFLNVTNNTFVAKNLSYNPTINERLSWALVATIRDAKVYNARNRVSISMMSDYYVDSKINEYSYLESVDTISELTTIPVYNGMKVLVKQYRAESDGKGGGLWEFVSSSAEAQNRITTLISVRTATGRWKKVVSDNTLTAYDAGIIDGEGSGLADPVVYAQYWTDFLQLNRKYKCFGLYGEVVFDPSAYRNNKIKIAAHRGLYSYYPENTMLAFSSAVASGADSLEVDAQITSDGILVCYHDASLDTLTNLTGAIEEKTLSEVITAKFNSLSTTRFWDSVRLCKLEDVLNYAKNKGLKVNIECNTYNYTVDTAKTQATVTALVNLIVSKNMENQVTLSSFTLANLIYMRSLNKNIRLGYLRDAINDNTTLAVAARWCCMLSNTALQVDKDSTAPSLAIYNKYVNQIQLWTSMKNHDVQTRIEQGFTQIIADNARGN